AGAGHGVRHPLWPTPRWGQCTQQELPLPWRQAWRPSRLLARLPDRPMERFGHRSPLVDREVNSASPAAENQMCEPGCRSSEGVGSVLALDDAEHRFAGHTGGRHQFRNLLLVVEEVLERRCVLPLVDEDDNTVLAEAPLVTQASLRFRIVAHRDD